jgi:Flp pilus assembly protein TadD
MGGIITRNRKKKDPAPSGDALSVETDNQSQTDGQSSVKSTGSSPSKKKIKPDTNETISGKRASEKKNASDKLKNATKKQMAVAQVSANKSSAKGREANKQFQRKLYLKDRSAKLRGRLKYRPTDQRALQEYASVLYEQENYITATKVIKRVLATGDTSGDWYLKLGKCYFRRWARVGGLRGE